MTIYDQIRHTVIGTAVSPWGKTYAVWRAGRWPVTGTFAYVRDSEYIGGRLQSKSRPGDTDNATLLADFAEQHTAWSVIPS